MIVKSVSHSSSRRSSIRKLIRYVFEKEKLEDRFYNRELVVSKQFLQSYDKDKWVMQLKANDDKRTFNHTKRTVLRHEVIAFGKQDNKHLTKEKLKDFIKFYFKHRSPRSMTVAGVHYEQSVHIHFVHSAVGVDGKSTRVSRDDFKQFKIKLQEYQKQKYPELSHSIVDYNKSKTLKLQQTQKEQYMSQKRGVIPEKEKLSKLVSQLASESKSLGELAQKLEKINLKPYYRYGKLTGIYISEKKKLRLTTLGVGKEHLKVLTKEQERLDGMAKLRKKRSLNKGRER